MSTASPLPLQPLPPSTVSHAEARALKHEVASRLAEHRQRRPRAAELQPSLPMDGLPAPRKSRVADSVAARFAQSVSYREFLEQEAESALRRAEAAAEIARRNAEAIAFAQQELLEEIDKWNGAKATAPAEVIAFVPNAAASATETANQAANPLPSPVLADTPAPVAVAMEAAQVFDEPAAPETFEPAVPIPANLIEFPRQLVAARKARPRFAEGPLREDADAAPERAQLRIFEVEASSLTTTPAANESILPEWHDIRLDSQTEPRGAEHLHAQISFALPLYTASIASRVMAAAVDTCCITASFLAAVALAAYASPDLPTGIHAVAAAAGTFVLFAALYQVLFFAFSDATPGMRYARMGLCTFGDENPPRAARLRRILALLLATLPLGLGVIWAFLDEENLGWHDRISRIYLREY